MRERVATLTVSPPLNHHNHRFETAATVTREYVVRNELDSGGDADVRHRGVSLPRAFQYMVKRPRSDPFFYVTQYLVFGRIAHCALGPERKAKKMRRKNILRLPPSPSLPLVENTLYRE